MNVYVVVPTHRKIEIAIRNAPVRSHPRLSLGPKAKKLKALPKDVAWFAFLLFFYIDMMCVRFNNDMF